MKKGQIYEGEITEYKFPNRGVAVVDGARVQIKGALQGQRVSFRLSKKRAGTSQGKLLEVLERSPLENASPHCRDFENCGGCTYQRLSYDNQLLVKAAQVRELLGRTYPAFEFEGILASPLQRGYRNKMEYTFGDETKGGPFALGLHRKESFHDIVDLTDCHIAHNDFNVVRNAVREFFNAYYERGEIDFYHQYGHKGYLRHLLVRRAAKTGEILVVLVTQTPEETMIPEGPVLEAFTEMLKELKVEGRIVGICHIYNNAVSDVVRSERTDILYGRDYIMEEVLGLKFKISIFSFFQTNTPGAELLYGKAREYARAGEGAEKANVIYDLYSGTGTITQLMSPAAQKVIGIEIVEEAVAAARENAERNGIGNVEFISGDVMKILCGQSGNAEALPAPDLIIVDPPREGIHPKALGKILEYGVDRIIYISCKPTSLADELPQFKAAGYQLEKAACVDMFPDTTGVETVCLLSKKNAKPKDYVEISVDAEDYYRIKSSEKDAE